MKIPKKLKIGNLIYDVGELVDSEASHFGKSSQKEQWLRISKNLKSDDARINTFFHEIIHQILDQAHFYKESEDEKMIDCIANGFYQVLKDNKLF